MSDTTNKTFKTLLRLGRLTVAFAWFDLWIGFYVDPAAGILYWCPLPCVVVAWMYHRTFTCENCGNGRRMLMCAAPDEDLRSLCDGRSDHPLWTPNTGRKGTGNG